MRELAWVSALCAASACTTTHYLSITTKSESGMSRGDGVETVVHECGSVAQKTRVAIAGDVTAGRLSWRLLDPGGKERWRDAVEGRFDRHVELDSVAGDWQLLLDLDGVAGSYRVRIESRGVD